MKKSPILIALIYLVLGIMWIFFSDVILDYLVGNDGDFLINQYQTLKGIFYVVVTSLFLYGLIATLHRNLFRSELQYRELFQQNPNPMWIYDLESLRFLQVNQAAIEQYGYSRDEFLSLNIRDIRPSEDVEKIKAVAQQAIPKFNDSGIWRHLKKDGELIYVHIYSSPITFDDRKGRLVLAQDVTQSILSTKELESLNDKLEGLVDERTQALKNANTQLEASNQELLGANDKLIKANEKIQNQAEIIEAQGKTLLNQVLSAINGVVWSLDLVENKFLYLSPAAEKLYDRSYEDTVSDSFFWKAAILPDDLPIVEQALKELYQKDEATAIYRIIQKDNTTIWLYDRLSLVSDKQSEPLRIDGIASDITAIKNAENEARENALQIETILESITDAFFALDKDWCFVRVNKKFEELLGVNRHELIGKNVWDMFPDAQSHDMYSNYHRVMEEKESVSFQEYYRPLSVWYDIRAYPMENGLSVYFRDITEEKNNQLKIIRNEQNLNALINNTEDPMWSVDREMRLISFNKAYAQSAQYISGKRPKIGDEVLLWDEVPEEEVAKWKGYYQKALQNKSLVFEYKQEIQGSINFSEITINPMCNEDGHVFGVSCYAKNITKIKLYEQEKSKLIERLLTQNKSLEEFAYMTSHSLRGPLASIMGILNLYERETGVNNDNLVLLEFMDQEVSKLNSVIEDISYGLQIREKLYEVREKVSLGSLLLQIQKHLKHHLTPVDGVIIKDFSSFESLYTIKSYLQSILLHLISNSIKFRHQQRRPVITVKTETDGSYSIIRIKDNGIGFNDKEIGGEIFKLYKRFHLHTEGRGLGLYLVKIQVEALNGTITVSSQEGVGTEFSIYLDKSMKSADSTIGGLKQKLSINDPNKHR